LEKIMNEKMSKRYGKDKEREEEGNNGIVFNVR
jgi:hypothetical protein